MFKFRRTGNPAVVQDAVASSLHENLYAHMLLAVPLDAHHLQVQQGQLVAVLLDDVATLTAVSSPS